MLSRNIMLSGNAITTYFDILGFKKRLETESKECIADMLKAFQKIVSDNEHYSQVGLNKVQTFCFSDSVVRTRIINEDIYDNQLVNLVNTFFCELSCISEIQMKLIQEFGILIRGGMSYGKINYEEALIFGESLVNASELEKKASYPRILVGNCLSDKINKDLASLKLNSNFRNEEELRKYREDKMQSMREIYVSTSFDRLQFIDYLKSGIYFYTKILNCTKEKKVDFINKYLESHKDIVKNGISNTEFDVHQKHCWLKNYHNDTILWAQGLDFASKDFWDKYRIDL